MEGEKNTRLASCSAETPPPHNQTLVLAEGPDRLDPRGPGLVLNSGRKWNSGILTSNSQLDLHLITVKDFPETSTRGKGGLLSSAPSGKLDVNQRCESALGGGPVEDGVLGGVSGPACPPGQRLNALFT